MGPYRPPEIMRRNRRRPVLSRAADPRYTKTRNRDGEGGRAVRTDVDHLPEAKRAELGVAVEIVREGFREALSRRTQERYRQGELLKLVLFGSYARGDWVEDPVGRYFSDFDLLAVVSHEDLTDPSEFWGGTEQSLLAALTEGRRLRTPVSLIVHSLDDVNEQLRLGRPFFTDILRDGILLLDTPDRPFTSPEPLEVVRALSETERNYTQWLGGAAGFLDTARYAGSQGRLMEAAFQLHQATERLYHGMLLVKTLYSPKTHSLNRLRALCEELDSGLIGVWPSTGKFERRCYELLRAAYVKARYSPEYRIAPDELAWLLERVRVLQERVDDICRERLASLEGEGGRT